MLRNVEKRGVQAARNGPSPPPCVAKPEMSTADRLGSKQGSSRAGWRELLTPWVDERDRSLSHCGAVSFKTNFSPVLDGRAVGKEKPVQGRSLYPKGLAQTMTSPQAIAAFRVQALERSRFAVGRLPAAYGDWSARPLACRSEVNGVRWVWNCLAELTTRLVSALRPSSAVARGDRATVRTRDFPSSPPMGDSFWLGL